MVEKGTPNPEHEEFRRRLNAACDDNPLVPRINMGRNVWIAKRMAEIGAEVSEESVRKWLGGLTAPRGAVHKAALAKALNVEYNWLFHGFGDGNRPVPSRRAEVASAPTVPANVPVDDIAKFLAIGLVQAGGGHVSEIPESGPVHFRATIKGARYDFHAVLGEPAGEGRWQFVVPAAARPTFVLGIIAVGPTQFRMVDLDWETAQEIGSEESGGARRVEVDSSMRTGEHQWHEIEDFTVRP